MFHRMRRAFWGFDTRRNLFTFSHGSHANHYALLRKANHSFTQRVFNTRITYSNEFSSIRTFSIYNVFLPNFYTTYHLNRRIHFWH